MNSDRSLVGWVNEKDHLKLVAKSDTCILFAYETLLRTTQHIEKFAKFARVENDTLQGYAMVFPPLNVGTGMHASLQVKFTGLSWDIIQQIACDHGLKVRVMEDGTFEVSNKKVLGISEKQTLEDLCTGVKAMIEQQIQLSIQ